MSRSVRVAAVQPPAVGTAVSHDEMRVAALELLKQAGDGGADIVCLPEYLNVMGRDDEAWRSPPAAEDDPLLAEVTRVAARHSMYVVLPLLEGRAGRRYNTAVLIDRSGGVVGCYHKTHLTAVEREDLGVTPGDGYPVFDLDFGRVGVMTCYDGHFPEPARILMLEGAELLLFPALQRHVTAEHLELQVRCRAVDNCVWVARASYGHAADVAWVPGMMAGKSCIVDFEATVLADAGHRVGTCAHTIDLDQPRVKERSYGGQVGDAADFLRQDRRPATYGRLIQP